MSNSRSQRSHSSRGSKQRRHSSRSRPQRIDIVYSKPSPDVKLDVKFKKPGDKLVVSSFGENPLLSHLQVGDEILSVNGKDCSAMTLHENCNFIKSIEDTLYMSVLVPSGDPTKNVLTVDNRVTNFPQDETVVVVSKQAKTHKYSDENPLVEEDDSLQEPESMGCCAALCVH